MTLFPVAAILPVLLASANPTATCPDDKPVIAEEKCMSPVDAFVSCSRRTAAEQSQLSSSEKSELDGRIQAEVQKFVKLGGSIEAARKIEKQVASSYSRSGHPGAEVEVIRGCIQTATPKRTRKATAAAEKVPPAPTPPSQPGNNTTCIGDRCQAAGHDIINAPLPDPTPPKLDAWLATALDIGELVLVIDCDNLVPVRINFSISTKNDRGVSGILLERPELYPTEDRRRFMYKVNVDRSIVVDGYVELRLDYESLDAAKLGHPPNLSGKLVHKYRLDDKGVFPLDPNERHQ